MTDLRAAEKAGTWYPRHPEELARALDALLAEADANADAAPVTPTGRPVAGIVPHAGLAYSGSTAARVYAWLRRALAPHGEGPRTWVVFGAAHRWGGRQGALWGRGAWRTPVGDVRVDAEFADALLEAKGFENRPEAHAGDNAIELQTPFLARFFPDVALLPITLGPVPDAFARGRTVARVARTLGRRAVALGSTDLTHYGAAFGLAPMGTDPRRAVAWAKENDRPFLEALIRLDGSGIMQTGVAAGTICGIGAAAAAAGFAAESGATRGVLLSHTGSHDATPDEPADHFVDYAAMAFAVDGGASQ